MFSNSSNHILTTVALLTLFCSGACTKTPPSPPEPINIGVINSLTGRFDSIGLAVQKGLEMAVEEINGKGGINGRTIKLLVEDDASKTEQAVRAFEKLANESKVPVIIGPLSSGASVATMPLANKYQVVEIPPVAGDPALTRDDDYVFRVYTTDEITARDVVKYAIERFKAKRVAVLNEDSKFGVATMGLLKDSFSKAGVQVVADERVKQGEKEFRPQLARMYQARPDLLIYPSLFFEQSVELTKQILEIIRIPMIPNLIMGTACLWTFDTVSYPPDVYFLNETFGSDIPNNRTMREFIANYRQRNSTAPSPFPAAGHATVYVVKSAMEKGGFTGTQIKSALSGVDVETAFGMVKFDSKGGNVGAGYSLYQLKDKQLALAQ